MIPRDATNPDNTLVARIIQDHYEALEGMFVFVAGRRQLTPGYVKELHAALLRNQETHTVVDQFGRAFEKPLEKGVYKTAPNNPTRTNGSVHEYCPPEHVTLEMERLIGLHAEHEAAGVPVEVQSAWLHHRFTQIHPFADGNGRVARALASLVFIKAGWFPFVVTRDERVRYLEALETADDDDLRPLVGILIESQRRAVIQATEMGFDLMPIESVHDAIAAARDRLIQRGAVPQGLAAKETAQKLVQFARERFGVVTDELNKEIGSAGRGYLFQAGSGDCDEAYKNVIRIAGFSADFAEFQAIVQLILKTDRADRFALGFYAVGPRFRGLIAVVAYLFVEGSEPIHVASEPFHINYEEPAADAQSRFATWLDRVIISGLDAWRRTL